MSEVVGPEISHETAWRIARLFPPADRAAVSALLVEHCGRDIPLWDNYTAKGLERIRFAALKLSGGDYAKLKEAVELAKVDWRDVLVAAGFGHDPLEHQRWRPTRAY